MADKGEIEREYRFCALLEATKRPTGEYFRCRAGRYDDKFGSCLFVWLGVGRRNKTVAAAQNNTRILTLSPDKTDWPRWPLIIISSVNQNL